MTRENDVDLSEGDGGNSKVTGSEKTCEMVRKIQPDCVLSIHQKQLPGRSNSWGTGLLL